MKRKLPSTLLKIIIAAIIVVYMSGCIVINLSDFNSVTPKGEPENYDYKVGAYSGIRVIGFYDIRYYDSRENSAVSPDIVTLKVQPNIMEYYKVEVVNDELVVRTTKKIAFGSGNSPVLTVYTPNLKHLTIEGAGTFTAFDKISSKSFKINLKGAGSGKAELDVDSLSADLSGAGEFTLYGRADNADLRLSGAGDLDAIMLKTRNATVNMSGAGSIRVSCSDDLKVTASGLGSVEYRGSPRVSLSKDGLVSIKQVY